MLRIYDCDCDKFFWGGHWFKDKHEARKALISFHSIDTNIKWLNSMSLKQICAEFCWDIDRGQR